jgi:hypothetical protein
MALKAVIGENSMVAISGDHWRRVRKMFNPAFAPSHLDTLVPAIVEESVVFVERLKDVADTGNIVRMNNMTTVPPASSSFTTSRLLMIVFNDRYYCEVRKLGFLVGTNGRVIFSIKLNTQQKSTEMIDALSRLIVDASVFTPVGHILQALNIYGHYARWRDERFHSPSFPLPPRFYPTLLFSYTLPLFTQLTS